ncbi:transcription factor that binds to CRE motif [Monascus purpureus]|uniref:Transcription factor that binds to CRE motif n=1 Tax=Monascus purpureus TaxID=5098 RepID=A0A507R2W7_MONPU|nr:transcription factor that binds to CRE motif [Monascus purpureus]
MASSPGTPATEVLPLTISPSATSLELSGQKPVEKKPEEKKPIKKRKSWGQELPTPKTNLPPRKRAKTEDEKEQRRIERVLRNRAAAQTSRERKRLEMEKLENEKVVIEQQNQFLLQRLRQIEAENNRLSQQVAQLSAEIHVSRGSTPNLNSEVSDSPTLTTTLFKQEGDDICLEQIPFPAPPVTDPSSTLQPSSLAESPDMTQHPAVMLCDLQSPLSDDDFRRLFDSDSSPMPDSSFPEDGFIFDVLDGGDLSAFSFDSLVDFDPESVALENRESTYCLPDEASHQTPGVQPGPGASNSRCDGQSLAASCH